MGRMSWRWKRKRRWVDEVLSHGTLLRNVRGTCGLKERLSCTGELRKKTAGWAGRTTWMSWNKKGHVALTRSTLGNKYTYTEKHSLTPALECSRVMLGRNALIGRPTASVIPHDILAICWPTSMQSRQAVQQVTTAICDNSHERDAYNLNWETYQQAPSPPPPPAKSDMAF